MDKTVSESAASDNEDERAKDPNATRIRGYASDKDAYLALQDDPPTENEQDKEKGS
mgnify:CR=1 FL=1